MPQAPRAARTSFPGAPPGSYVSDEGWLIVGDEAWTLDEWTHQRAQAARASSRPTKYHIRYATDDERREAKRRVRRESARRRRAGEPPLNRRRIA